MALEDVWQAASQVWTADFWTRLTTRPWEAVIQHPALAAKSALVAGAVAATGGLALKAAPVVVGAVKALAAPVSFAARHPILTYLAISQADLPTEIVRAFGARAAAPAAPPLRGAATLRTVPPPAAVRRPAVTRQADFQALFGW